MSTPDLAPSLPSRVVTGRSTEVTERGPIKGGTVTISLSQAILSVPDKTYLEASSVTVPLDSSPDGSWEVRLPTVSASVEPRDSWTLTVKYSTRPYPFQIRVPAGTGPIDIADIGEVHGVAPEHAGWVVTGMQIGTVTTGPAAARISGQAPTLTLDLTIPKGEKGDPGAGIAVLGTKATTADLPTGAKVGDAWLVGTDLHVWNGTAWTNTGSLRGPTGATGATPQLSAKATTLPPTSPATASVAGPAGTPELTIGVPKGRDGASITKVEQTGGQSADVIITDPNTGKTTRTSILLPAGTATFDEVEEDIWEAGSGGEGLVTAEQLIESLAGKADTTDPRLTNARTPTSHKHPTSDLTGITVDTSVGTRILIDGHMVYGAIPTRDVTASFASGLAPDNTGTIRLSKLDRRVVLEFAAVKLAPGSATIVWANVLPTGFTPARSLVDLSITRSNAFDTVQMVGINGSAMYWLAEMRVGSNLSSTNARPTVPVTGQIDFYAPGWPTTLPGSPA